MARQCDIARKEKVHYSSGDVKYRFAFVHVVAPASLHHHQSEMDILNGRVRKEMIGDIVLFTTPAWGITASVYQLDMRARRRIVVQIDVSFSAFPTILIYAMYATTTSLRIAESFKRQCHYVLFIQTKI